MRRVFTLFILMLIASFVPLRAVNGADGAVVSLLTCSPGEEVYAFFGHTALRYQNRAKGLDVVFNYGVFDFQTPNFVGKFVLGETDYMLGATDFPYFIQEYAMRGSRVTEHRLALDSVQVEHLFGLLRDNYRPANRVYRYNYFYNNCTTKARDIVESAVAPDATIVYPSVEKNESFRDAVHRFTAVSPWYSFGIDLLLGAEADAPQDARRLQFIPSVLMGDFESATIVRGDSARRLVEAVEVLVEEDRLPVAISFFTPNLCFALLLLLVVLVTYSGYRRGRIYWAVDVVLLLVQGVAGVLIAFMVMFSVHPTVGSNMLIMLLNPMPLLLLPLLLYAVIRRRRPYVMWLQSATVLLFLAMAPFVPQYFPLPVYLFAAALLVRSLYLTFYIRK
jgi:hypothetical protein